MLQKMEPFQNFHIVQKEFPLLILKKPIMQLQIKKVVPLMTVIAQAQLHVTKVKNGL